MIRINNINRSNQNSFLNTRFNDIQTYLKKIDDDESLRETSSSPIIIKASEYLPQSTKIPNDRKLTKYLIKFLYS